jgi:hypothetical protein
VNERQRGRQRDRGDDEDDEDGEDLFNDEFIKYVLLLLHSVYDMELRFTALV